MFLFNKQKPKEEVKACNHKVCYKCGYLFETGGKEVEERAIFLSGEIRKIQIFCKNCTPKYDYVRTVLGESRYFRHQPDIEVNEKGEPIKKK